MTASGNSYTTPVDATAGAGSPASTLRSCGMDLLRWWRGFLWAVGDLEWDRTVREDARDCRHLDVRAAAVAGLGSENQHRPRGQAKAARRTAAAGVRASAASLACDLELARAQIKELRAERDTLKAAVQRGLGAALETAGTRELTMRINELLAHGERLATERDAAVAENGELKAKLVEAEDNLTAARASLKKMIKGVNRDR